MTLEDVKTTFIDRDGNILQGIVSRIYKSFEGPLRYIIVYNGKEYRCERNGMFLEEVVI